MINLSRFCFAFGVGSLVVQAFAEHTDPDSFMAILIGTLFFGYILYVTRWQDGKL